MKGFDVCIKSFARFYNGLDQASKKKVELVLVGKGEEEARLKEIVKELKLEHCIHFVSWVNREELADIYGRASVFFFPSHEGAGMVIPEAMSYGLPIVCFDNVGPGELAMNSALKVPYTNYQDSVQSFSMALDRLFSDKRKYRELADNALYNFYQHYTWERKGMFIQRAFRNYLKTVS
jgi:glycosyltransferase involved in cell wall biosynthesis